MIPMGNQEWRYAFGTRLFHARSAKPGEKGKAMTELKTCPFCGGEAQHYAPGPIDHHIECVECYADIQRDTEAEAIAAWNSRAERTCKIESSYYYDDYDLYEFEFSCGHLVNMYDKEPTNYCPICGAKVTPKHSEILRSEVVE